MEKGFKQCGQEWRRVIFVILCESILWMDLKLVRTNDLVEYFFARASIICKIIVNV